jgi:hypothetical protein
MSERRFIRHSDGDKFYEVIAHKEDDQYICATASKPVVYQVTPNWPLVTESAVAAARLLHGQITVYSITQSED